MRYADLILLHEILLRIGKTSERTKKKRTEKGRTEVTKKKTMKTKILILVKRKMTKKMT